MSIPGKGLAKGLAVTLKTMTKPVETRQYPDVQPELPPRSRGVIALLEANCTVCMLCARECPDWCIYIDSHKETVETPGAARSRQRNVLDRFDIDFSLCMYCGICVEVCPFDPLLVTRVRVRGNRSSGPVARQGSSGGVDADRSCASGTRPDGREVERGDGGGEEELI